MNFLYFSQFSDAFILYCLWNLHIFLSAIPVLWFFTEAIVNMQINGGLGILGLGLGSVGEVICVRILIFIIVGLRGCSIVFILFLFCPLTVPYYSAHLYSALPYFMLANSYYSCFPPPEYTPILPSSSFPHPISHTCPDTPSS